MAPKNQYGGARPFILGGISGSIATCVIQPIDMVKVRLQLVQSGKVPSPFEMGSKIIKEEGVGALYKGLSAGILRQLTYTTARMGIFGQLKGYMDRNDMKGTQYTFVAGMTAGALGAVVGTPADLSLIRMQSDSLLPKEQRANYKGVFDTMSRIVAKDGFMGLFEGCTPTVVRAAALNTGMFVSQDEAKKVFSSVTGKPKSDVWFVAAPSAMTAGFFSAAVTLPFDMVKSRIQSMVPDPKTGAMPYSNSVDCAAKILANEGPLAFYKGFTTFLVRIGPHVTITLLVNDLLNKSVP